MSGDVRLPGKLFVTTKSGRFGDFNVTKLVVSLGEFVVKDQWTDQLEPGAYAGTFEIGRIFPKTIVLKSGAILTELRARVDDFALLDDGEVPDDIAIGANEPDPISEDEKSPEPASADDAQAVTDENDRSAPQQDEGDSLASLFGEEIWPLGEIVELDPAADRERFRKQRDHLKACGYKYQANRKAWALQKEE